MAEFFKGDATEKKFYDAGNPTLTIYSGQKDLFFDDAYNCFILGDVLYETGLAPLVNAMPQNIFREAFSTIFESFLVAGSLESYMTVFRKIFGDTVEVEFEIPAPGKLNIDVTAAGVEINLFITRYIENNAYVFDEIIDDEGDNIVFQTVKGLESEYELTQMLFELVPDGIYTEITLTIGS